MKKRYEIDIREINYIDFKIGSTHLKYTGGLNWIENWLPNNFIFGSILFLVKLIFHFLKDRFKLKNVVPERLDKIVFIGTTKNNRITLTPLLRLFKKDEFFFLDPRLNFPRWKAFWYSLPYFFDLKRQIKQFDEKDQYVAKRLFSTMWLIYGYYILADKIISENKIKLIIFANDHSIMQRCFIANATKYKTKTLYVQHASVTENFPPLKFSYSFLDGMDAYEKYKKIGQMEGNIFLTGAIRFDNIANRKGLIKSINNVIGIATNQFDEESMIKSICLKLKEEGHDVIFRPHPAEDGKLERWCYNNGVFYSHASKENSFQFLNLINLLIANESSIHLDAIECRIPTILFNMSSNEVLDWYGYIKKGLIKNPKDELSLLHLVKKPELLIPGIEDVRYFNASYLTKYEGLVSVLVKNLIVDIILDEKKQPKILNEFELFDSSDKFKAYRFKYND